MDELLNTFITEANEGISVLDSDIVLLEKNPEDSKLLGNIFRVMHTLKGTCGFLGLPRLESIAHASESVLGLIREGEMSINENVISLILKSIDIIKDIVAYVEENSTEPEGEDSVLIGQLEDLVNGISTSSNNEEEIELVEEMKEGVEVKTKKVKKSTKTSKESKEKSTKKSQSSKNTENKEKAKSNNEKQLSPSITNGENTDYAPTTSGPTKTNQTIRVNVEVLEDLMQMVSELVLTRNQLLQMIRSIENTPFHAPFQRLNHITSELQETVMKARMQPVYTAWVAFPRITRDLSVELNKKIDLKMSGEDTELDKQLLECIKDPLTHMVRNAIDHGIESPEERVKNGKPKTGTIHLNAYHQGGHIIIEISDDGKGISGDFIAKKALEKELVTPTELAQMNDSQIINLIFLPGFSTAEKVTNISGRGVGMDVVKTNIEKISGTIELFSTYGKGSKFLIKIPLTLAIMPVLTVSVDTHVFAIPQVNVVEMIKINPHKKEQTYQVEYIHGHPVVRLREQLLPLIYLSEILNINNHDSEDKKVLHVVICEVGGYVFGIIVDKIHDTEEIVVKPVSPIMKDVTAYSGITILGDGSVIMILDIGVLLKHIHNIARQSTQDYSLTYDTIENSVKIPLLLFTSISGASCAVPLELVSRLEELDLSKIEYASGEPVLQYRDRLIRICTLSDDEELPTEGQHNFLVFTNRDKVLGIGVKHINDIVKHEVNIRKINDNNGFLGSIVINNKVHDIIDVNSYFIQTFELFEEELRRHDLVIENKNVMFIDDSPLFREFIPPVIENDGYNVEIMNNALEALDYLAKDNNYQNISAIVTDINMPEMDGYEFINICQNREEYKNIPIVVLSSQAETKNKANKIIQPDLLAGYVLKTNHNELLEILHDNIV